MVYRLKAAAANQAPSSTTPRPANASLPSVRFESLPGTYTNAGYGPFELCLMPSNSTAASSSCQELAANASVILPGAVNASVPTFLAVWNSPLASHIRLTHFEGNIFNLSMLLSFVSRRATDVQAKYYTDIFIADRRSFKFQALLDEC